MEREACVCDNGLERSDFSVEIIIIILVVQKYVLSMYVKYVRSIQYSSGCFAHSHSTYWLPTRKKLL